MSTIQARRPRGGQNEDQQVRRWGGIGIAAVAAAKSVKPAEHTTSRRDTTVQRLIDSVSE